MLRPVLTKDAAGSVCFYARQDAYIDIVHEHLTWGHFNRAWLSNPAKLTRS
jgi:hypothetical protein